jgi:hypothetical protein
MPRVERIGGLHFHVGRTADASTLVERHHYSGRVPANLQCVGTWHTDGGLFGDAGEAVAACFFSIPPTRWSEDVLELSRLVRSPDAKVALTGLIAATVRFLNQKNEADLLVSFADATQGHHGGIYQAASWAYAGQRDRRMDGLMIDGHFMPGRNANHKFGTQSPAKLRERMPERSIDPHYDEGKHLYWRALNKAGRSKAAKLHLESLPYPKPAMKKDAHTNEALGIHVAA